MELCRLYSQQYSSEDDESLHKYLPQMNTYCKHLNKITLSTELAQAVKSPDQMIPEWCSDQDIFSEKTHDCLPPHRSYDHTIDLKLFFVPKIAKVYSLNPKEQEACKAFIDEYLKTRQIIPSKSPQAAPFFFVAKTTNTWTSILFTKHIPYLSFRNWLITWKTLCSLPSSISDGSSTTFTFGKKLSGKICSSLLLVFLNQWLCSLDFAMDCPPLWPISLQTWSWNGG